MHGHDVIDPAGYRVDDILEVLGEIALPLIIGHGIDPGHARFCQLLATMRESMNPQITFGARVKKSPYFDATVKAGVTHFSIYNHTYMPTSYAMSRASTGDLSRACRCGMFRARPNSSSGAPTPPI